MADHFASAVDYIGDALEARDHLTDLYELPADERDTRIVAGCHETIRISLKLAEIHASLDVGQQLRDVRAALEARS